MSTLKANKVRNVSATVDNLELDSSGNVSVYGVGDVATALAAKLPIAGGKILQIVRATDNTGRSTTSTSYVDVTGMSVSITPQKNTSSILIVMTGHYFVSANAASAFGEFAITNSANTAISGATDIQLGHLRFTQSTAGAGSGTTGNFVMLAYASPATTSATTYKLRWKSASGSTLQLLNDVSVGQMYAIEVSA